MHLISNERLEEVQVQTLKWQRFEHAGRARVRNDFKETLQDVSYIEARQIRDKN